MATVARRRRSRRRIRSVRRGGYLGRDKIFDADLEYVSANEIRHALKGHHCSELWGDDGLISATMRCVDALERIGDLVTTDYETKETFIRRVRKILGLNV